MKKRINRLSSGLMRLCAMALFLSFAFSAYSQQIRVTGVVSDKDGTFAGVAVYIKGTGTGQVSDDNGEFIINVPSDTCTLQFVSDGYVTKEEKVGTRRIMAVEMLEDAATKMKDVTMVAFASMKTQDVLGSVTSISPAELKIPSSNLTTALAGKMSGIIAYQRSGEPGRDNAEFFIRGVTTFGYKKDPLILIDNNESSTQELSRLQPDDIANFTIMKDATATALYGSRGANGVILVSTKQGFEGKAKISIRYEEAISTPTKMVELADPITYMHLHNESYRTRGVKDPVPYSQHKIENTINRTNPYAFPANDWYDNLFKKVANNHRLNFNVAGGGKVARYYLAGSVINDNGLVKVDKQNNFNNNVNLNRYMLRANIDISITNTTEAAVRMSGSFDDYAGPIDGGQALFQKVMRTNPVLFPAYFLPDAANQHTQHILYGNARRGANSFYNNPYADMTKGYKDYTTSQVSVQFELKQKLDFITDGLSIRGMFNTNRYSYFEVSRSYNPFWYQVSRYNKNDDTYVLSPLNETSGTEYLGYSEGDKNVTSTTYFESSLNWNRTFGVHGLSGLFVYTMRDELRANAGDLQRSLPYRNMSFAGRATYGYDSRYLAEFNFGYNGSERFSKKERFGFFPSAGVGWIISNEAFWENFKSTVSNLKLKATYGFVGNDAIGDANDRFFYLSNVNMDDSNRASHFGTFGNSNNNGRINGVSVSRYANDLITWETAEKMNYTLELGLFKKIDLQVEYFQENRTNILMDRAAIPTTMGLQAALRANVGEAKSRGIDMSLNFNHSFNKDTWITGMANFTYATSEFTVYEEPLYLNEPWKRRVGYSLNQNWGYIAERLFVDDEEVRNSPDQRGFGGDMAVMGGDIKYRDLNGDGKITELDMAPIGYPTSPEIVYGFGMSSGWKWFDFSFFFQGLGRESFWISPDTAPFIDGQNALLQVYADSHWSEENRNIYAMWPRLSSTSVNNNRQTSTWFMRNGSFLRLKSVELGYSLPSDLVSKMKMTNFRVYFSGTNLLTFSNFKLWDPEMGGNGLGYPIQKVFNFGVQLSF